MAVQDLTPQLRTRLSRLERVVALFVVLATALMVAGLYFYVRRTAERKGWYVVKLPYFTFVDSAAGLKVGDPVKMMGFDVGEIGMITAEPPESQYAVYIGFRVKEPFNGYLWDDSRAQVVSSLLGSRYLEVTKGTNGVPAYYFNPMRTIDVSEARVQGDAPTLMLGEEVWDASKRKLVERANQPLNSALISRLESAGVQSILVVDKSRQVEWPTHVWDDRGGRYAPFNRKKDKGYFLVPDEQPALTEVAAKMLDQVKEALPNVLALTNRLQRLLDESAGAAAEANVLLSAARPAITNLALISGNLTNPSGSLGQWLIPPEMNRDLSRALKNANTAIVSANAMLTNTDARLDDLVGSLGRALEELSGITSNLHNQVDANTNIVSNVSRLIVDTDHFVQGLKRHWLLRSAFKDKATNAPSSKPTRGRFTSPKASDR